MYIIKNIFIDLKNGSEKKCEECAMMRNHAQFTDEDKLIVGNSYLVGESQSPKITSAKLMKR